MTVRQEWTDRGVPPSADRLTVDGLSAARALVDAINPGRTDRGTDAPAAPGGGVDSRGQEAKVDVHFGQSAGGDGSGEHGRVAAARKAPRQ